MSSKVLKFGIAGLAIAGTMVACNPGAQAFRVANAPAPASKSEQQAVTFYARANEALRKSDFTEALTHAERAVELSPQDVGYRMLLADLYLKKGRFQSAATTFEDVLALDPVNVRAGLSVALARAALGQRGGAIAQLDEMQSAPAADLGLAYALSGDPKRAIELLEPAAREVGANGRIRQNLALAYALAGDWQKARTTAAQDVSPDQLNDRLQTWAALAQPKGPADQVAALLGVTPAASDEGQPVRLALAPAQSDGTAFAAADPAPLPATIAAPASAEASVQTASYTPPAAVEAFASAEAPAAQPVQTVDMAEWVSSAAPQPEPEQDTRPVYAAAVEALVTPQPAVIRASAPVKLASRFELPAAAKVRPAVARTGRFAVQLGAFGSPAAVERAWASAYKRYGFSSQTPLSTMVKLPKGTFHRLSVAGFASHSEATAVCRTVKAKGGVCFVRAVAGDAPVRWASRYTSNSRG